MSFQHPMSRFSICDYIEPEVLALVPTGFTLRGLEPGDYDKGYMDLLSQLTTVGQVSREAFLGRLAFFRSRSHEYFQIVIEDNSRRKIVAAGTVFVEFKFIHGLSAVAHMEDVVSHKDYRGKGLGIVIMRALKSIGRRTGCYKVILDCNDKNVPFYEKAVNMKRKENQMVYYYSDDEGPGDLYHGREMTIDSQGRLAFESIARVPVLAKL